jgi:hypothetical protein
MLTFDQFKINTYLRFKAVKNPAELLDDDDFVKELSTWYLKIFGSKPKIYRCGTCLYEKFTEMAILTEKQLQERLNLPYLLKEGEVVFIKSIPYSRQSPHMTIEIMGDIIQKYPNKVEKNPFFKELYPETTPEPVQIPRKTRKKR